MRLALSAVERRVGAEQHLYPLDLAPAPGAITVLLGATLSGKTSLMRLMAGLDKPSAGRITVDGADVTGTSVRHRGVAMVYQQFINYPSMTVFDNIASPLRLARRTDVRARVQDLAARLHIEHLLDRLPAQLSGGQQQRVALARALAKDATLTLLDEPLVNLDYKLREELRDELTALFSNGRSTVVYATTEPSEALLLGGYTAVLDRGRLLQYGPTAEVFHRPATLAVARAFSDPPMNLLPGRLIENGVALDGGAVLSVPRGQALAGMAPGQMLTVGVRAVHLSELARPGDLPVPARVELAEISGSETYLHVSSALGPLVAQWSGVHRFSLGQTVQLHLSAALCHVFDADGRLVAAPQVIGRGAGHGAH
jgi:glycerol transport system ATP-binding protein